MYVSTGPSLFDVTCPDLRDSLVVFSETSRENLGCHRISKRLGTFGSMFNAREITILDALDDHLGLEKTKRRNCAAPKRVSSILHWRTLGSLLETSRENLGCHRISKRLGTFGSMFNARFARLLSGFLRDIKGKFGLSSHI